VTDTHNNRKAMKTPRQRARMARALDPELELLRMTGWKRARRSKTRTNAIKTAMARVDPDSAAKIVPENR
jgi:hypothetical protein